MNQILAIDPGTRESALMIWDASKQAVVSARIQDNEALLAYLIKAPKDSGTLTIEMVACYGMPVGCEVFETCVWIGRFIQAWQGEHYFVYRQEVKMHFCHTNRAKDPHIRQALIDRFGPAGTKKNPGKLYGVVSHLWSALAVAVFYSDNKNIIR